MYLTLIVYHFAIRNIIYGFYPQQLSTEEQALRNLTSHNNFILMNLQSLVFFKFKMRNSENFLQKVSVLNRNQIWIFAKNTISVSWSQAQNHNSLPCPSKCHYLKKNLKAIFFKFHVVLHQPKPITLSQVITIKKIYTS